MSPNFDILRYAHQVTEFLMGFPMIPQLCSGVIPFRNYETIKTTYRCDCCRNTFRENGLWKKDSAHTLKKIIHIVYWVRSASRRSVTSVFTKRPWHWNWPDYVFLLLSRYFYNNIFLYMYFRIIKESPYEVTINEHEHILHIQRCHTHTCISLPGRPLLVWMCILCMWNTHIQTGCLACVPAPSIRVYKHTISLVTDPLCYLNLRFVKRSFAKLYYVNLLGTFVGLVFCIQARFSHVKSKNRQTMTYM